MNDTVSYASRRELVAALRSRYRKSRKLEKTRILDEFVAVTGSHRKHAIRLLRFDESSNGKSEKMQGRKIYDEAVHEALIVVWEAADRICGKRLKAVMPRYVDAMEQHGHLALAPEVRVKLLAASASTLDRLLRTNRTTARKRKVKRSKTKPSQAITIKTFAEWNEPDPGFTQVDFVVHCGGQPAGEKIHSLVMTDVCSGWTEAVPLLAREQTLVVEGLSVLALQIPMRIRGINSDNDSAFINETLLSYCREQNIDFTRSRPYKSNDQAWIEQKNGDIIRRFAGPERFSGVVAGQALAALYASARLYVNYFQPSFKLLSKHRDGSKLTRIFRDPKTPCDRLLEHAKTSDEQKEIVQATRDKLDPVELLHRIRECQSALANLSGTMSDHPVNRPLSEFLSELPTLWKSGDARPTHQQQTPKERHWRTRSDPFVNAWPRILEWLEKQPDITAKAVLARLSEEFPDEHHIGQLRTLQRRVKRWRKLMARKMVYACLDTKGSEARLITPVPSQGASPQTPEIF